MRYTSTRGGTTGLPFVDTVIEGLAPDGGLFCPETVPQVSEAEWDSWRSMSYTELAFAIMRRFIDPAEIPDGDLRRLVAASYSTFRDPQVTPLRHVPEVHMDLHVLELFHGPTFAFKDVALQFLGNLFEYILERRQSSLCILGATSGDTGSAAIYGVRGKKNIDCVILYPHGRTSPTQEMQMTTVPDENIHCVAVKGVFDDCQDIVKALFRSDLKKRLRLGAVNSINWARILAQIVYYAWAAQRLGGRRGREIDFVVPTGNFGDILAGYYARRMGMPVGRLVIASNSNDILPRFFASGEYRIAGPVTPTLSPSMDIQISSNFERFLFDLLGRDAATLRQKMADLSGPSRAFQVSPAALAEARKQFSAHSVDEQGTKDTILDFFRRSGVIMCPHSAVAVRVAQQHISSGASSGRPVVSLATAHFGKFVDILAPEMQGRDPQLAAALESQMPAELRVLRTLAPRRAIADASVDAIRSLMTQRFRARL
eukprot:TRINITY_DN55312_c0_g1_i1.p1 TRINITY_DN55312_c0_g1~~TRINITY_DN55312_c0_g1_i1.p1  ORF type:complete len:485 (+),score=154.06 TRINITY_DN55312_c0_g1_i1:88-1542(+)